MTDEEYKKLSLKEFDRAAEKFDDDDPSVYNMCRRDYPDVLAEAVREPFSDLLDACCGTGGNARYVSRRLSAQILYRGGSFGENDRSCKWKAHKWNPFYHRRL